MKKMLRTPHQAAGPQHASSGASSAGGVGSNRQASGGASDTTAATPPAGAEFERALRRVMEAIESLIKWRASEDTAGQVLVAVTDLRAAYFAAVEDAKREGAADGLSKAINLSMMVHSDEIMFNAGVQAVVGMLQAHQVFEQRAADEVKR